MMPTSKIKSTLRSANRYREILTALARYGFEDFVIESGLDRLIERGRELIGRSRADADADAAPLSRPARLRMVLEELGPTFIKMGQILSTREDLIPPEYAREFRRLQDDCPQLPYEAIAERLEDEFPDRLDDLFESIDETAVAAASLAQVHRAVMRDGSHVVIKVLRPGVRATIDADMDALNALAHFLERHWEDLGFSPVDVVNEFSRELQREIDLTLEAQSAERLRRYFENDPNIFFPRVYWQATTRNVLTMEEIKGKPISRIDLDTLSQEQRRKIVEHGADAVFKQCLQFGFFHADPHPGNIFVLDGGKICFIDCGMTGHVDARTTEQLADLVSGVVAGDLDRVIQVVIDLANVDPMIAEDRKFRSDVWNYVSRFSTASLEQLDMAELLDDFFALLRKYHVKCPSDLVFLIKAITTIQGVGERVDPSFDLVGYVKPHIERLLSRRYSLRAVKERLQRSLVRYVELAEELPNEVRMVLDRLHHNRFSISLEHKRLDRLNDTVEHASRNIAYALIIAALVIGSSILVLAETGTEAGVLSTIGVIGLIGGAVLTVMLVLANVRFRKKE